MASPAKILRYLSIAGLLVLGACAPGSESFHKEIVDKVVEVQGPQARVERLCLISATVVELATHRALAYPLEADKISGNITRLQNVMEGVFTGDRLWLEVDLMRAAFVLDSVVVEGLKASGFDLVTAILGKDVQGALSRAELLLQQSGLGTAAVRDINNMFRLEAQGTITLDDIRRACVGRINKNKDKVNILLQ